MFSITTIASSTTKPVEIVERHQRQIVEAVAQQVHHAECSDQRKRHRRRWESASPHTLRRKTNTTRITSTIEIISVSSTSWTDARIVVVRSITTVNLIAGGDRSLQLRQHRVNAVHRLDDVGAGLAEDDHQDAGLAVRQPALRMSSTESDHVGHIATADGAPLL